MRAYVTMSQLLGSLTVAGAMLCIAPLASAQQQQSNDGGIGFGLEAGITRSTLEVEISNLSDFYDSRNGVMGGIWFGGNRNGILGFMGEITYVIKGATEQFSGDELKLHYLEIPALIRINLGQTSNKWGFLVYPMVGPVVDIQLKGELDGVDIKDQFNGYDVGIVYGVGVKIARIGIEVRANNGLLTLEKTGEGTFGGLVETKSSMIQALVKIRLI